MPSTKTKKQVEKEKMVKDAAKEAPDIVTIYNTVGVRGVRLGKGGKFTQLILPGKNVFPVAKWKEISESEDGKKLIEARIVENLTEKAKKPKKGK